MFADYRTRSFSTVFEIGMTKSFPSIMLIGMAGVGKSTVGKLLARNLGYKFIDTDKRLAEEAHMSLTDLINQIGEDAFLKLEDDYIRRINFDRVVVAPGGSIAYHADAVALARSRCRVIFLKDDILAIKRRVPNIESRGIIGMGDLNFEELYARRQPLYQQMADVVISIQGRSVSQIVRQIVSLVK